VVSSADLIGNTPIVKIGKIYAKLESVNPGGSIKDRAVFEMIRAAERKGELKRGYTIVEPTSGNTGISIAMLAAVGGYKAILVMPEGMSRERIEIMKSFGARVILTKEEETLEGAIRKAKALARKPRTFMPNQFENPDNTKAHHKTGREILEQVGIPDAFVAGVGTGGTLMGVAEVLKAANPNVKIIAVEPKESSVMSGGKPGKHQIQGIGDGFIPDLVDMKMIDEVIAVSSEEAIRTMRDLAQKHGILVGISSGANFLAAKIVSRKHRKVVTVFPDRGERYLSSSVFR
jgi:cysteine synthase A